MSTWWGSTSNSSANSCMTIVAGLLLQKPVPELRGAVDAALLGGADPYPDLPSLPFAQPPLLLVPEFKVGQLQNLVQYSLVVAAAVEVPVGDKVRELLWLVKFLRRSSTGSIPVLWRRDLPCALGSSTSWIDLPTHLILVLSSRISVMRFSLPVLRFPKILL